MELGSGERAPAVFFHLRRLVVPADTQVLLVALHLARIPAAVSLRAPGSRARLGRGLGTIVGGRVGIGSAVLLTLFRHGSLLFKWRWRSCGETVFSFRRSSFR